MTEILKEYEYTNKDGKSVKIKRKYTIEGSSKRKQKELDEFFSNNADRINTNTKIKALLDEYNDSHEMKISYSMFYTKYKKVFGTKRERRNELSVCPSGSGSKTILRAKPNAEKQEPAVKEEVKEEEQSSEEEENKA